MLLVASMAMTLMMVVAPAVAQEDPKDVVKQTEKRAEAQAELDFLEFSGAEQKDIDKAAEKVVEEFPGQEGGAAF
jgi:beta-lactam-binding protein with PASTA domain